MTPGSPARIVMAPAMHAGPDHHWYRTVGAALTRDGHQVDVLDLPDPAHPDVDAWMEAFGRVVGPVDDSTVLIGHSLGGTAILTYLSRLPGDWSLGGLVLVAPFVTPLDTLPELDGFVDGLTLATIHERTALRHTVLALDDYAVPPDTSYLAASQLGTHVTALERGGHFLSSDGHDDLPEVSAVLRLPGR